MEWQSILPESLKGLAGHLTLERVLIDRGATKMFVCFLSDVLVADKEYVALRKALQKGFVGMRVSLRVCSPALADDVRANVDQYTAFFGDFLARSSPGIRPWLQDARWSIEDDRMVVSICSEAALRYVRHIGMDKKLVQMMWDVFRMQVDVAVICEEDVRARMERLRELDEKGQAAVRAQMEEAERQAAASPRQADDKRICGRQIHDAPVPISTLREDSGTVTVRGEVVGAESRELKGGTLCLLTFCLTDYTSSIGCKMFLRYSRKRQSADDEGQPTGPTQADIDRVNGIVAKVRDGVWLTLRGDCQHDNFAREATIMVNDMALAEAPRREDRAERKRVELHLHTQMSNMDAISSASALIEQAAAWGHEAIAITDHGVVQAFPEAFSAAQKHKIKLIPGVEGYLTDEATIVDSPGEAALDTPLVVLDFETTGLVARRDRVIEIGAVKVVGDEIIDELSVMIDPGVQVPPEVTKLTGITTAMLQGAPAFEAVADQLLDFMGDAALAAHNAKFDMAFLQAELARCGRSWQGPVIDTLPFARKAYPMLKSHKLSTVCRHLGISLKNAHRAVHDARATAQALMKMLQLARGRGVESLAALNTAFTGGVAGDSYHVVLLATSQDGMTALNRLVSEAHLHHFHRKPTIPRALLQKHRKDLLVGSACASGELYEAILEGKDEKTLSRIARFYDYLEIQPVGNNDFLLRSGQVDNVEALRDINRRIVALGDRLGLPVVATGDVHFLKPEDAKYRAILMAGKGFDDADEQPPLYFHTTDEMLEEFAYLGPEKAMAVVVDAPQAIAGRVGETGKEVRLFPPHPQGLETFQPFWEDAAAEIEESSWAEARRLYGDDLPPIVAARLEKELSSIIGYGFATLYAIARRLVEKSLSDGYLVGSRGSVGSSFVATMCGITEVNPLPPHYLCPQCKWSHFDEKHELAMMGVDLPPRVCPQCGAELRREGCEIPFEVFLGFEGDKVPDIDLNFSGVYQPRAHKYVEELFGAESVFRAGTIGTLADKTAYGYVANYLQEREQMASEAEKNRLVKGCVGVKRTTGQHPGGIVVLPKGYEIYQFTAIQHPADDTGSSIITTHYDFGSMHDVLVKLDILGHDDPTMINMLQRLTGVDPLQISLSDEKVLSLFSSPEALDVTPQQIGCNTGTLGVPEFGTTFVRGNILEATKPNTMEELVRISGLSHGTNVWLGNAADLVAAGTATLSECICTRDDIMNTLMQLGVAPKMAFDTMEAVRKGKGLRPEMEQAMRAADTPQWFIDSCKKIKYLFPKGHAVAYVTMALRVAWFKVYHPIAYYAAYYTVRADAFDVGLMSRGADGLKDALDDFYSREKELTAADKDQIILAEIGREMYQRGISLLPIDLYKSEAAEFLIVDGAILPPFTAIPGLGLSAAQALCEAKAAGPYMSVEDLRLRSKVSTGVIEQLRAHGALRGLAETSQVSLF